MIIKNLAVTLIESIFTYDSCVLAMFECIMILYRDIAKKDFSIKWVDDKF